MPVESHAFLDAFFFLLHLSSCPKNASFLCQCHQLTGQHRRKETEMELAAFSSVCPAEGCHTQDEACLPVWPRGRCELSGVNIWR